MPASHNSRQRGQHAERQVARFLQARGLRLLARNHHCRAGEIDLVMLEGSTLVFVEVRYRAHDRFGSGAESVDGRKQDKLRRAAEHYLLQWQGPLPDCRFDVVQVTGSGPAIEWIRDAFQA